MSERCKMVNSIIWCLHIIYHQPYQTETIDSHQGFTEEHKP